MPQINPSIPILLQPDATEDPKVQTALSQLIATINALDNSNIAAGAAIADTKLGSPASAVWETVMETDAMLNASFVPLTNTAYWFPRQENTGIQLSGAGATSSASGFWVPSPASDVAIGGRATKLRLRSAWATNATAPGINITWALHPVTTGGATPNIAYFIGTAVPGSGATATAPSASSTGVAVSAGFDMSAVTSGVGYLICVTGSSTQNASSVLAGKVFLEMQHV